MVKKNSNKYINVLKIFFKSINTYFKYFDQTSKALLFPVLGQLLSLILIFTLTYLFNTYWQSSASYDPDDNMHILFFVILIPLFIIFTKALYDYIIYFASFNLLYYTRSNKKAIKKVDMKDFNSVIKMRFFKYFILMLLISILLIIPPLVFIAPLTAIFLSLSVQVYAFEADATPMNAISRSFSLVKSNFIPTLIIIILCFLLTYKFVPSLFIWSLERTSFYSFMMTSCEKFVNTLPLYDNINSLGLDNNTRTLILDVLSPLSLARNITEGAIAFLIISFTMPFRCCCFTELYKLYDSERIKDFSKNTDTIVKRAKKQKKDSK